MLVLDGFVGSTALSVAAESTINGRPGIPSLCEMLVSPSLNLLNQYCAVGTATLPFPSTWHFFFHSVSSCKFLFPIVNQKQSNFKMFHDLWMPKKINVMIN